MAALLEKEHVESELTVSSAWAIHHQQTGIALFLVLAHDHCHCEHYCYFC